MLVVISTTAMNKMIFIYFADLKM